MWSLTKNGFPARMSYNKTCPVAVPTPRVKPPWKFRLVTEGSASNLQKKLNKSFLNSNKIKVLFKIEYSIILFFFLNIRTYFVSWVTQWKPQSKVPTLFLALGSHASTFPSWVPTTNKWWTGFIEHLLITEASETNGCKNCPLSKFNR